MTLVTATVRLVPVLLAAGAALACTEANPPLRIDGSPGVAPLVSALAAEYIAENSRAPVTVGEGLGSSARIQALEEGRIDLAMASHGIDTADLARRGMTAHDIARTAVVFAADSSVGVNAITSLQVCAILAGRVTSWRQLGGRETPIIALMRPDDEVDAEVAREGIPCLRELKLAESVRVIERPDAMADTLMSTRGAFGVTSMPHVMRGTGRIVPLTLDAVEPTSTNVASGSYPLSRQAWLISRTSAPPSVQRFLDYVRSEAGRAVLGANGAVPVR